MAGWLRIKPSYCEGQNIPEESMDVAASKDVTNTGNGERGAGNGSLGTSVQR